ncbi:MAG: DUF721 domain-containing protein [Gammaproteobacteria bacterium]|nr:DUF721 domain-containing protein [Gammaproteobacteria bacterium]
MSKYQKLNKLLSDQSNELHTLVSHAQFLARSNQILLNLLSEPLKKHIFFCNISNETMIITVDSAAWLTKAKLQLPEIFEKFKQMSGLTKLKHTRIKVDPSSLYADSAPNTYAYGPSKPIQAENLNPFTLSGKTLSQISSAANNLNEPKLKKALLNLAKTLASKRKRHRTT